MKIEEKTKLHRTPRHTRLSLVYIILCSSALGEGTFGPNAEKLSLQITNKEEHFAAEGGEILKTSEEKMTRVGTLIYVRDQWLFLRSKIESERCISFRVFSKDSLSKSFKMTLMSFYVFRNITFYLCIEQYQIYLTDRLVAFYSSPKKDLMVLDGLFKFQLERSPNLCYIQRLLSPTMIGMDVTPINFWQEYYYLKAFISPSIQYCHQSNIMLDN